MGGVPNDAVAAAKKKGKQQLPLPSVDALVDKLPFSVEYKPKLGRQAVAKVDMPAGTLVMLEEALATTARTRSALHVCHRCFVSIPPPAKPQTGAKAVEDAKPAAEEEQATEQAVETKPAEGGEEQQSGSTTDAAASPEQAQKEEEPQDTPAYLDPCLPRYCASCAGKNAELDARLAACRSHLLSLCKKHQLEPELLQLLLLLDVQHAQHEKRMAQDAPAATVLAGAPPAVRCAVADLEAVPSMWDRRNDAWRKMVTSATKTLHKELVLLAESGAVPGYTPSSLVQLQALAGALGLCLQGVGPENSSAEPGLGLFPALTLFPHSCVPNCSFVVAGQTLQVRTLVDVPAGTPLNVAYIQLYEPRAVRRHQLLQQRAQLGCSCLRCTQPIEESTDRFLEGVWCMHCRVNVLVQLPPSEKWEAEYQAQQEKDAAEAAAAAAAGSTAAPAAVKPAPLKKSSKAAKKGGKQQGDGAQQAAEPTTSAEEGKQEEEEANGSTEKQQPEVAEGQAELAEGQPEVAEGQPNEPSELQQGQEKEKEGEDQQQQEEAASKAAEEDAKMFWRCCGCGRLERARGSGGLDGPLDVDEQATRFFSSAMMMLQMKVTGQALARAEGMLTYVRGGVGGRLHPYNIHCLDALDPLLSLQMRKGDALAVFNTALVLWEAQRMLLDLPSPSQLNYLSAIEDAARHKATNASSAVMKKQFERKAKAAQSEIAYLRKVLYGQ